MTRIRKLFFCCALTVNSIFAQDEEQLKAPVGLAQSGERTMIERTQFLLDVGEAYMKEQDLESARGAYERCLEIDPKNKQAQYILAHVYISIHQYKQADILLTTLVEEYPEDFSLWNNLAWLYATATDANYRDGRKAIQYAHEALTLAPEDYHVWSTLAEAYYVSGQYDKAYRSITTMANLIAKYAKDAKDITEESIKSYNEQIRKCKRAMDAFNSMQSPAVEEIQAL